MPKAAHSDKPVRVAILGTRGIPAKYGGFETFAEQLSVRLVQRGVSVTVYCEGQGSCSHSTSYRGVKLRTIPAHQLGPFSTIVFDIRCLWDARRGFDIVYMLGYGAALFCFLPKLFHAGLWINMDGIEWRRSKWSFVGKMYLRFMERVAVSVADLVIADAQSISDHLNRRFGPLRACRVIPYGADVLEAGRESRKEIGFGLAPGAYYLIVCRLEPENHVEEMIKGYLASKATRTLVVVGDHTVESTYVRRLRGLGSERVRFVGAIYDNAVLQNLRLNAFAYLHGHSVGGTNPSLLEAMGAGNPILAHDNPFNREALGGDGLYFHSSTEVPRNLARIDDMASSERADLEGRLRERIRRIYSWDRISDQYMDALRECTSHSTRNRGPYRIATKLLSLRRGR